MFDQLFSYFIASNLISSAVLRKFFASLKIEVLISYITESLVTLLNKAHEDTRDFPPSTRTIRNQGLALIEGQMSSKLQRKLILLVESQEGIEIEFHQLFPAPWSHLRPGVMQRLRCSL